MANNGGQYDPRVQAMEEVHFDWRCIVRCMVALSPLHLEQQHLPGTESVYFDLDNTPWVKCDKCHTPFHLQCGTWESLYVVRSRRFLCTFFCRIDLLVGRNVKSSSKATHTKWVFHRSIVHIQINGIKT